jgi:hypothetical protein
MGNRRRWLRQRERERDKDKTNGEKKRRQKDYESRNGRLLFGSLVL